MAGSQKAEIELVAKDTSVAQAIEKLSRGLDKTVDKLNQVERASAKGTKAAEGGFGQATMAVGKFVGAVTGIGSVIGGILAAANQLRREWENIKSRQQDAATAQLTVAQAQRAALFNFSGDATVKDENALKREIEGIQQRTGAGAAGLFTAASTALSFKGNLTAKQALEAVEIGALIEPADAGAQTTIAQAILAQQQKTGGTAQQIAGFQIAAKQASPVATNEAFAQNIAPGIAKQVAFGDTPREAAALLSTLGQGIGDPEGRITQNAAISFSKQLMETLPNLGSTKERIEFIRSEEGAKVRAKLLGVFDRTAKTNARAGLTGEAKAFTTLVGLLSAEGNATQDQFAADLQKIPELAASGAILNQKLAVVGAQPLQQNAAFARGFAAGTENLQLRDLGGGRRAIARKGLQEMLKASGAAEISQTLEGLAFEAGAEPIDSVIKQLSQRSAALANPKPNVVRPFGFLGSDIFSFETEFERNPAEQARDKGFAESIDEVVEQLKQLNSGVRLQPGQQVPRQPAQAGLDRNE